jgi:hypothetical protein
MRAPVLICDKPVAQPEDTDLQLADRNDAMLAIG